MGCCLSWKLSWEESDLEQVWVENKKTFSCKSSEFRDSLTAWLVEIRALTEVYLCLFRKELFNTQWAQVLGLISLRLNFLTLVGQFLMPGTAPHENCFWLCLFGERYQGLSAPGVSLLLWDQSCYQKNGWGCFVWKCQPSELGWCDYPDTAIPANLPIAKAEQRCKTLTFMF